MAALPFSLVILVMEEACCAAPRMNVMRHDPANTPSFPSEPWQIPDRLPGPYDEKEDNAPLIDKSDSREQEEHRVGLNLPQFNGH